MRRALRGGALREALLDPGRRRENYLRAAEFRGPWWIPCKVVFAQATWSKYRERLEDVVLGHPWLFPGFRRGSVKFDDFGVRRRGNVIVDEWGCKWTFLADGLQGQVVEHPLEDWGALEELEPPSPDAGLPTGTGGFVSWEDVEERVKGIREEGGLVSVGLPHGFFFQRLYYLRGYSRLLADLVREDPRVWELISLLEGYLVELVRRIVRVGVDVVVFGDDLGNQDRMPVSPRTFRRFIFPSYRRIFGIVRSGGAHVYLHTDGHVVEVVDQLMESGVTILNVQDRVNGLENIEALCAGRVCVDIDVDRQRVLPFGSPAEVEEHVKRIVDILGSGRGGLMLTAGIYPDVPLENVEALCSAVERYMWLRPLAG